MHFLLHSMKLMTYSYHKIEYPLLSVFFGTMSQSVIVAFTEYNYWPSVILRSYSSHKF